MTTTSNRFWAVVPALLLLGAAGASQDRALSARGGDERIEVFRAGAPRPILVQNAKPDFRPYVHPIVAPDGKGELTEFAPGHHRHQTGLYWGFTRVNGRDYFHHPGDGYYKRVSMRVTAAQGATVGWEIVYQLNAEDGRPVLEERQTWTLRDHADHYVLDLTWEGRGLTDVVISKYDYGGLFLRMPWREGAGGLAVNSDGLENERAEGLAAKWVDVGMKVPGRDTPAHIVVMDHPGNPRFPPPWRVDGQLGVGPCTARQGDWRIAQGAAASFRHRFLVYTGPARTDLIRRVWGEHEKTAKQGGRR